MFLFDLLLKLPALGILSSNMTLKTSLCVSACLSFCQSINWLIKNCYIHIISSPGCLLFIFTCLSNSSLKFHVSRNRFSDFPLPSGTHQPASRDLFPLLSLYFQLLWLKILSLFLPSLFLLLSDSIGMIFFLVLPLKYIVTFLTFHGCGSDPFHSHLSLAFYFHSLLTGPSTSAFSSCILFSMKWSEWFLKKINQFTSLLYLKPSYPSQCLFLSNSDLKSKFLQWPKMPEKSTPRPPPHTSPYDFLLGFLPHSSPYLYWPFAKHACALGLLQLLFPHLEFLFFQVVPRLALSPSGCCTNVTFSMSPSWSFYLNYNYSNILHHPSPLYFSHSTFSPSDIYFTYFVSCSFPYRKANGIFVFFYWT